MRTIIPALLMLPALLLSQGLSADDKPSSSLGNVVVPKSALPRTADQCVEATDVMRRDHMKFLLQQRDATVIEGIRSKKYSLVGCMNCHNPTVENVETVGYENPDHFCAGCHLYTAVKIDCFECHADRGQQPVQQSLNQQTTSSDWIITSNRMSVGTFAIPQRRHEN